MPATRIEGDAGLVLFALRGNLKPGGYPDPNWGGNRDPHGQHWFDLG